MFFIHNYFKNSFKIVFDKTVVVRKDLVGDDLFRGAMGYCVCSVGGENQLPTRKGNTHKLYYTLLGGGERRYIDLGGEK